MDRETERLLAHAEIGNLLARYMRAIDDRDAHAYAACLSADVVVDHPATGRIEGRAAAVAMATRVMDSLLVSQHLIGNLEVEVHSASHARARFEIQAMHRFKAEPQAPLRPAGAAYDVSLRREDPGWRCARVEVRERWMEPGLAAIIGAFKSRATDS